MIGMRERVTSDGITAHRIDVIGAPDWADNDGWRNDGTWYQVTLDFAGRLLSVPFYMGSAHTDYPEPADVLNCLVSDASGWENAQGFEDWASDYGYDTDSRRAERTYRQVAEQTELLRAFLGEQYDAYLWDTEGL